MINTERALKQGERILAQVRRNAGKGIKKATAFLAARWRETVNVPAPTKWVTGRDGVRYKRATKRATPGAPIRKVTGRAQQSINHRMVNETTGIVGMNAVSGPTRNTAGGFPYPAFHEGVLPGDKGGDHQHLEPTVERWRYSLRLIIGGEFEGGMRSGS